LREEEELMTDRKKKPSRMELGRWGESIARDYLVDRGYLLIEQNYRTADGEIDLIMKDKDTLVFVEVKTRFNLLYGLPEEAVDEIKIEHLEAAIGWYFQEHSVSDENWQLDVITVVGNPSGAAPQVDWFRNVTAE